MRHLLLSAAACALATATAAAQAAPDDAVARGPSRGALARGTLLAITNVSVVPMTSDTVLAGQTVVIRDGRIAAVGPAARVRVPAGARRIDGGGKFLIPGLADMHAHLYSDGDEVPDSAAPAELGVMVANGVTAARLMIGTPEQLALRRDVAAGRVLGPQLWLASPQLTGRPGENARVVTTPDDARAAVREAASAGYDFIKLTTFISRAVYDAVVEEAARQRIRVVGHVDPQVGLARALEAGQQIEHLDDYFESVLADGAPSRTAVSNMAVFPGKNWESLDHVDDAKIARVAGATARAGVWSGPTLAVFNRAFAIGESDSAMRARPDWAMIPPNVRALYLRARERYWSGPNAAYRTEARRRRYVEVRNRLTKAIHDSGGKILAGSDSPEWLMAYGWTLHRELEHLVEAGLTPYQALAAATRNPAEFLGATAEWGTVAPGRRADLVLLSANPLRDIRNTTRIDAVALGGRWLERAELDRMIRTGSEAVRGAP